MTQITDAARTDLHNRVRDVLGEQEGDTLMAHLPPVGWADVATKKDIDGLAADIDRLAAAMKKDIENVRLAMKADVERGFRRQTVWMASLVIGQSAMYMAITFWLTERLSG